MKKKRKNNEGRRGGGGNNEAWGSSAYADDFPHVNSSGLALSLYTSERETSESLCPKFNSVFLMS